MIELVLTLSTQQLCYAEVCATVSVGCEETPTRPGTYSIKSILLNPLPVSPLNGLSYSADYLGGKVITFENTNFALHGWHNQTSIGKDCSLGCARVPKDFLDDIIYTYLWNNLIIKP